MFEMINRFDLSTPVNMINFRLEMVQSRLKKGEPVAETLIRFGVSRRILYKFIKRFKEYGKLGLCNLSKSPLNHGRQTPHEKIKRLFEVYEEHPYFSDYELNEIVSIPRSTIQYIRKKNNLVKIYKPKKLKKKILEELKKDIKKRKKKS